LAGQTYLKMLLCPKGQAVQSVFVQSCKSSWLVA
jgi:hypothetical protein